MMKSKFFSSAVLVSMALAASLSFVACGDDNNPGNATETPSSSSIATGLPDVSSSSEAIIGNSSASVPTSSTTGSDCAASPVAFPQDKFTDIGDVYKNIQCNEKVVFIVRHAEREARSDNYSALIEDGFEAATVAGKKLAGTEPFKYIFSGMVRTYQTAAGIAAGRGETVCTTDYAEAEDGREHLTVNCVPQFQPDTLTKLKDGWYTKDKDAKAACVAADTLFQRNSNVIFSEWVYNGVCPEAFYDLDERSKEIISYLVKDYKDMPKYTLAASHDQVLMPLTAWATEKKLVIQPHSAPSTWLNYLAGVAIIINDKNEQRYVAVKGMNDNVQPDGTVIDGGVQ